MVRVSELNANGTIYYEISGGRPDWGTLDKVLLAQDFLQTVTAHLEVGRLIDPESGNIDGLHRRHIISWNRIKEVVAGLINADHGAGMPALKVFAETLDIPGDQFDWKFNALFREGVRQEGYGDVIKELLVQMFRSRKNTFIGFASENLQRNVRFDNPCNYGVNAGIIDALSRQYRAMSRLVGQHWSVEERVTLED